MKRKIFFILSLFLICSFYTFGESFPQKAKSVKDFIPKGWEQLYIAKGDLNKDKLEDVVIVIRNGVPVWGNDNIDVDYVLLVLFKEKDGTYSLVAKNDKNFMGEQAPRFVNSIEIRKNTLIIEFYYFTGAHLFELGCVCTFRFQNNKFELIGYYDYEYNIGRGDMYETSVNFSTNKMKITTSNMLDEKKNKPKDEWKDIKFEKKYILDEMTNETIDEIRGIDY